MTSTLIIRLDGLGKRYGAVEAVRDVNLEIAEGEFLTLLGPSGCGKTTIIRMIAGYIDASAGRIFLDGRDITDDPPQKRRIGMVFQHYALFPHLTVEDNVGFALKIEAKPVGAGPDTVRCRLFGVDVPVIVGCPAPRGWSRGGRVTLGIRPEHLRLSPASAGGGWAGRVEKIRFVGSYQFAAVRAGGE